MTTPDATPLSITGRRWRLAETDFGLGMALAQRLGVPEIIGRIMAARGIGLDQANNYLDPQLNQLPDPSTFKDMDTATERLCHAIQTGEQIAVFGDYDVDGSCAAAMLLRYFRQLGLSTLLYIPDRMTEGYGPNPVAMERLKAQGTKVVITVDCGSLAFAAMARAAELGMDVIITDHHQTTPEKPACHALINPNRMDESGQYTNLCGAGVAFLLVVSINRALRKAGYFHDGRTEPDLRPLLDLVATATVCDVVPLTGINRVLVDRGLKMMAQRQNPGLTALADIAGLDTRPQAWHAGFLIGPRINAGGRISACDLGARLLSTDNPQEAQRLAAELHHLNTERQQIEQHMLAEAMTMAEAEAGRSEGALVLVGEGWHPGVVGIVASRIKEVLHRPTFVLAAKEGVCKGSGRSVSGIDLGRAVLACADYTTAGGGHAMAAGVTLPESNLAGFRKTLNEHILRQAEKATFDVFTPTMKIDGVMAVAGASLDFLHHIDRLEPYGAGNPEPRFAFNGVRIDGARIVGEKHLKCRITDNTGKSLDSIAFRAMDTALGPWLLHTAGRAVNVCGKLSRNVWNGRETAQLVMDDGSEYSVAS